MRALGDRAIVIRGNGERELVEARLRLDAGSARIDPDDVWSSRTHWAAGVLDQEQLDWMAALPPLASIDVDGLGDVLFCHASPRSDEEIVTPLSPEARIVPMLAGVAQRTVVLGHTHVQFDREVARPPARQRRQRRPAVRGPRRSVLGAARPRRGVAPHDATTSTATCARVRESGIPDAEEYAEGLAHPPPAAEANEFFERMATRPA